MHCVTSLGMMVVADRCAFTRKQITLNQLASTVHHSTAQSITLQHIGPPPALHCTVLYCTLYCAPLASDRAGRGPGLHRQHSPLRDGWPPCLALPALTCLACIDLPGLSCWFYADACLLNCYFNDAVITSRMAICLGTRTTRVRWRACCFLNVWFGGA